MKKNTTIITVTYNAGVVLERTIQSIIAQKYENIEYIIVDGCSSDNTIEIIKEYEKYIDKWISEKDSGLYDAMNKGISLASGDWLFFMNAGDVFYCDSTLQTFFNNNKTDDYDIIYGDNFIVNSDFKPVRYFKSGVLNRNTIRKGMPVSHQSIFVRLEKCPLYDVKLKLKAEYNWLIDILYNTPEVRIEYINAPVIKYPLGGVGQQRYWENILEYISVVQRRFGIVQTILNIPRYGYIILNYWIRKILKIDTLRLFNNSKNKN